MCCVLKMESQTAPRHARGVMKTPMARGMGGGAMSQPPCPSSIAPACHLGQDHEEDDGEAAAVEHHPHVQLLHLRPVRVRRHGDEWQVRRPRLARARGLSYRGPRDAGMGGLGRQVPSPPVLCARDAVHGLNSPPVNMRTPLARLCAVPVARAAAQSNSAAVTRVPAFGAPRVTPPPRDAKG